MKIKPILEVVTIAGATFALTACSADDIERQVTGKTPATEKIAAAFSAPVVPVDVAPALAVVSVPVVIEPPKPAPECVYDVFRVSRCIDGKMADW